MRPQYDATIILGCKPGDSSKTRTIRGAQLILDGLCKTLILVGNKEETAYMIRLAKEARVPAERIAANGESKNTVDNAYYAKQISRNLNAQKIALVTSAYHLERALAIFRHLFGSQFLIVPIGVDDNPSSDEKRREEGLQRLIPLLKLFAEGDDENMKRAASLIPSNE